MLEQSSPGGKRRLSRDEWLSLALDILAKEGASMLTIDELVRHLGVSRGSFYWHFKSRTDFIHRIVQHWSKNYNQQIADKLSLMEADPKGKLMILMDSIERGRLTRYDIAIRAWASREPKAESLVKQADQFRLDYVASLLKEIGFMGEDLEMRTRLFVVYESMEIALFSSISDKQRQKLLKLRHALITQPIDKQ